MPSLPVITSVPLSTTIPHISQPQKDEISTPQRNAKGQFLPGNTESVGNDGGRPCTYCANKDHYQAITDKFFNKHKPGDKPTMPYLEELALELDIDEQTISDWVQRRTRAGELEHPEFAQAVSKVSLVQKLRLKQRVMGRYNPAGAMFLLEANHGIVRASKQILAGDKSEPLQIEIISEGAHHVE